MARSRGRPQLRFKDLCKRDLKACNIDTKLWEALADNRNLWKLHVSQGLKSGEAAIRATNDARRARRIACHQQDQPDLHLLSYVRVAAETANLGLASTTTQDDVPRQTLASWRYSIVDTD